MVKKTLFLLAVLALTFGTLHAGPFGIGWTCTTSTSCAANVLCVPPGGGQGAALVTRRTCCPPPCQFPCEIQPCQTEVVGVSCGC